MKWLQKTHNAVVAMAANFNLGVVEDVIEELPQVSEGLTNEELMALKQDCLADEKAQEKEAAGGEKELQRKFTGKRLAVAFADFNKLLKKFEYADL